MINFSLYKAQTLRTGRIPYSPPDIGSGFIYGALEATILRGVSRSQTMDALSIAARPTSCTRRKRKTEVPETIAFAYGGLLYVIIILGWYTAVARHILSTNGKSKLFTKYV